MSHPSRNSLSLVLASSSSYRRNLLSRLKIPFTCDSPDVDETPRPGESARALALRLARTKAHAVAPRHPASLVIGSDQVAEVNGHRLGKPGGSAKAVEQLQMASGGTVVFHTGLCVLNTASGREHSLVEPYFVTFRELSEAQIRRYVDLEQPFDCAGSFRAEELGIALFEKMEGADPNSLIGLPLIRLVSILNAEGLAPV